MVVIVEKVIKKVCENHAKADCREAACLVYAKINDYITINVGVASLFMRFYGNSNIALIGIMNLKVIPFPELCSI